jgi:hypothetical protein
MESLLQEAVSSLVQQSTPLLRRLQRQLLHRVRLVLASAASPHLTPPHAEETVVLLFNIR